MIVRRRYVWGCIPTPVPLHPNYKIFAQPPYHHIQTIKSLPNPHTLHPNYKLFANHCFTMSGTTNLIHGLQNWHMMCKCWSTMSRQNSLCMGTCNNIATVLTCCTSRACSLFCSSVIQPLYLSCTVMTATPVSWWMLSNCLCRLQPSGMSRLAPGDTQQTSQGTDNSSINQLQCKHKLVLLMLCSEQAYHAAVEAPTAHSYNATIAM